jgi:membrane fusion protein (multidrug efflux system)
MNRLLFQSVISLLLVLILISCDNHDKTPKNVVINVPVYQTKKTSLTTYLDYIADIEAQNNIELRARVNGYLESIHVDEGDFVKKGSVLFTINGELYQNELNKAQSTYNISMAEAKTMEYELMNTQLLVDKGVVNKIELEIMKAKLDAAYAKIEDTKTSINEAQIRLSHTKIKAPFDGYVDRFPYKVGSLIERGNLLTTVSDVSFMNVYFNVSETEYLKLKKAKQDNGKQEVELLLADGSIFDQIGVVETIEGEFESGTGSIAFRAKFKNPNKLLKHNASGKIRLNRRKENVFLIPQKACFEIQEKTFVFTILPDNSVKSKSFVPVRRYEDYYIVEGQFDENEKIVFEGIQKLKDGMKIKETDVLVTPQFN